MTREQQEQLAQLEETIRQAQQQIEELKNPKPKKFEWKYSFAKTYGLEIDFISTENEGNHKNMLEHGRYRL